VAASHAIIQQSSITVQAPVSNPRSLPIVSRQIFAPTDLPFSVGLFTTQSARIRLMGHRALNQAPALPALIKRFLPIEMEIAHLLQVPKPELSFVVVQVEASNSFVFWSSGKSASLIKMERFRISPMDVQPATQTTVSFHTR
jgi:hypothetical protein